MLALPAPCLDAPHHPVHPAGPLAARGALPARLHVVKARDPLRHPHHARGVVHDHDRPGAEHRARRPDGVVVHVDVHHELAREHRHRRAPRDHRLQAPPVAHPAGHREELAKGGAEGDLEVARAVDVTGDGEHLGPARVLDPERPEPLRPVAQDRRNGRERLGIVDGGRPAVEPGIGGERGLEAGHPLLALERLEEPHFLPADVGARPEHAVELEVHPGTEDVRADEARLARLGERALEAPVGLLAELAPDVVVADGRPHRVAADGHPLDDRVRVVAKDVAVLAGAGLALVGIAHHVVLAAAVARHEAPLEAGREAGPAAAPEAGGLDHLDHVPGGHPLPEDPLPRLVAADPPVILPGPRLVEAQGLETDFVGHALLLSRSLAPLPVPSGRAIRGRRESPPPSRW